MMNIQKLFGISLTYSYLCPLNMERKRPLVSFIITYYQLPVPMLCECIDSILALPMQADEREIIVVDDGSDTSPMNGLLHYGDSIVYVRQKHGGVSVARNTALNMAQGDYIQFVDGDDCLLDAYGQCLDIVRQYPDAEVVMFDFTHEKATETRTEAETVQVVSGTDLMRTSNLHGAICCCLFHRSVLGQLRFQPGIHYGEDEDFTAQLIIRAEQVYPTHAKAYYYRERSTSAVHQQDSASTDRRLDDTIKVIVHLQQVADTLPYGDRQAMQRRVAQLTMDFIYNTIVLTHSRSKLEDCVEQLRQQGLFPLPDKNYSQKYVWFRRMSSTAFGRLMLLRTLPLLKRER